MMLSRTSQCAPLRARRPLRRPSRRHWRAQSSCSNSALFSAADALVSSQYILQGLRCGNNSRAGYVYAIAAVLLAIVILFAVFNKQIVHAIQPAANKIHRYSSSSFLMSGPIVQWRTASPHGMSVFMPGIRPLSSPQISISLSNSTHTLTYQSIQPTRRMGYPHRDLFHPILPAGA